jgi:hypothetical protein
LGYTKQMRSLNAPKQVILEAKEKPCERES